MSLYLLQRRYIKACGEDRRITFPAKATANIELGPEDAFGVPSSAPRTTLQLNSKTSVIFNANEGISSIEAELIQKVQAHTKTDGVAADLNGNRLRLTLTAGSLNEAGMMAMSLNQFLPPLFTLHFQVFIWIKSFRLYINDCEFNYEVTEMIRGCTIATGKLNSDRAIKSLQEWRGVCNKECHRLISALYYLRHAHRLFDLEPDPQSMTAEVLLNLAKALEIVFSSNREELRRKANAWGFEKEFVEKKIVPVLLFRNQVDVAHPAAAPLTLEQWNTVRGFLAAAMVHVREVLRRVTELVMSGGIELDPMPESLDKEKEKLLETLKKYPGK